MSKKSDIESLVIGMVPKSTINDVQPELNSQFVQKIQDVHEQQSIYDEQKMQDVQHVLNNQPIQQVQSVQDIQNELDSQPVQDIVAPTLNLHF